jgi:hypothetical protein
MAPFDRDGNRVLEGSELAADARLRRLDLDGDGHVGVREARVAWAQHRHKRKHVDHRKPGDIPARRWSWNNPLANLRYQDQLPANRRDPQGRYLGATETMCFVVHRGALFATTGLWMDKPYGKPKHGDPWTGPSVLRKESATGPWVVDVSFANAVRIGALIDATVTRSSDGRKLPKPVNLLLAAPAGLDGSCIWTREATGRWTQSPSASRYRGGFRSLALHADSKTQREYLFGGTTRGAIFRAAYDPATSGGFRWSATPELEGVGRVMALAVANERLYAACGIESDASDSGGLFVRLDGAEPTWELIWRWPYRPRKRGDESEILRGLTPIPAPDGQGEVMLGYATYPGVVYRIDPRGAEVKVVTEINVREYFAERFGRRAYVGPALGAYNNMTPYVHPDTGEELLLIGLWIREPVGRREARGAYYLVRRADGSYGHGYLPPVAFQST